MTSPVMFSVGELIDRYWPEGALLKPPDALLGQIYLSSAEMHFDVARGVRFDSEVVLAQELELSVPGMDGIRFVIGGDAKAYGLGATVHPEVALTLGPGPTEVRLSHPALRPVDRVTVDGTEVLVPARDRDGVSIAIEDVTVGWSASEGFVLRDLPVFSLPLVEIAGTGLVVGFDEVDFVLRDLDWSPAVTALGFGPGFRGILAESATLFWLPELQLLGEDLPGLRLELGGIALGNEGVSFDVDLSWLVTLTDSGRIAQLETELLGSMFDDRWQIALERAHGEIRANVPRHLWVDALLDVPLLSGLVDARFGLAIGEDVGADWQTSVRLASRDGAVLQQSWTGVALTIDAFTVAGNLSQDGFDLAGTISFDADIFGFDIAADSVSATLSHSPEHDDLTIKVTNLTLGVLGTAANANVSIIAGIIDDDYGLKDIYVVADYQWSDLKHLMPASTTDVDLPDEARIEAMVRWQNTASDTGNQTRVEVELRSTVSDLETQFDFLPDAFKPEIIDAELVIRMRYASAAAFVTASDTGGSIEIEVRARMTLRLPSALDDLQIPGLDLLTIDAGDEDGLLVAEFALDYQSADGRTQMSGGFEFTDLINVDITMPGGRAGQPMISTRLTRLGLVAGAETAPVTSGTDNGSGTGSADLENSLAMVFEGSFAFRPYLPEQFPFATHLQQLLHRVGLDEVKGDAGVEVSIADDAWRVRMHGAFEDFGIELDLFSMISALASGTEGGSESEIDIDFEIGFRLIGFEFDMGTDASGESSVGFDLVLEMNMTGQQPLKIRLRLSDSEFSLGIVDLRLPLAIPRYPIGVADLQRLAGAGTIWTAANLDIVVAEVEAAIADLDATAAGNRSVLRDIMGLELRRAMLQVIMEVHARVGDAGASTFQTLVTADTAVHEAMLDLIHIDTGAHLHFPDIKLSVPFDNPSGIALSGKGRLAGIPDGTPFKRLEDFALTLGLSSEYIYARLESDGEPIPLPLGSRYQDGTVSISNFGIGYGYSKNSFAFDFKGQLDWPTKLIEDADTSDRVGAGIRLPRHNRVFFKIDTIIVTIGKATIGLPVPQFDIDLRTPSTPAINIGPNGRVRPAWDGFEVIAQNIVHADFKRIAFSPFFGPVVAPNAHFYGDIDIGTAENGATLILNDLFVIFGVFTPVGQIVAPIPLVADPTAPYFEDVAVNLRVAGFEVNFRMQRPFPNPSPLAAIEAFGLVSNPRMELDPLGALANTIRFTIDNAYVRVPDRIVEMFPALGGVVEKRYSLTLNLATLQKLLGTLIDGLEPLADGLEALSKLGPAALQTQVERVLTSFDPWRMLALLPPELRKFRVGGRLAGFEASTCFVLATEAEARDSLGGTRQISTRMDVSLPHGRINGGRLVAEDETMALFAGIEFRQFEPDDIDIIGTGESDPAGSVFMAARVRVFAGQRIRFLGRISANGSFVLISSAQASPLCLRVFGIKMPLEIKGNGRLRLVGNHRRTGYSGHIEASGWFDWQPIPRIARFQIGSSKLPARLRLHSDGHFLLQGEVAVDLFGGSAAVTDAEAVITEELAAFTGRLRYAPRSPGQVGAALLSIDVTGAGHLAVGAANGSKTVPLPSLAFEGAGTVILLGQRTADVDVKVNDRFARFQIKVEKQAGERSALTDAVPVFHGFRFQLNGQAEVDLRRKARPSFVLRGEGKAELIGATLEGRALIRAQPALVGGARKDRFDVEVDGRLVWRGRPWVDGRLRIGNRGARIEGTTTIGVALTPPAVSNLTLPHLHLQLSISADFGVDANAITPDFTFKGSWQLGAVMAPQVNTRRRQLVPLAGDRFTFDSAFGLSMPLLDLGGLQLLPIGDFIIPKPTVTLSPATGAKTVLRAGRRASNRNIPLVEFWTPLTNIGLGPFPYVGGASFASGSKRLYSGYDVSVDWDGKLALDEVNSMSLRLEVGASADGFPLMLVLAGSEFADVVVTL